MQRYIFCLLTEPYFNDKDLHSDGISDLGLHSDSDQSRSESDIA